MCVGHAYRDGRDQEGEGGEETGSTSESDCGERKRKRTEESGDPVSARVYGSLHQAILARAARAKRPEGRIGRESGRTDRRRRPSVQLQGVSGADATPTSSPPSADRGSARMAHHRTTAMETSGGLGRRSRK